MGPRLYHMKRVPARQAHIPGPSIGKFATGTQLELLSHVSYEYRYTEDSLQSAVHMCTSNAATYPSVPLVHCCTVRRATHVRIRCRAEYLLKNRRQYEDEPDIITGMYGTSMYYCCRSQLGWQLVSTNLFTLAV